jgi:hypothetical protein
MISRLIDPRDTCGRAEARRDLGLTSEETAFYDALAENGRREA